MVLRNVGIASLVVGIVVAIAAGPDGRRATTGEVRKVHPAVTQTAATSRLDALECQAAKLAAAFPIVTQNDGPNSMAVRQWRHGRFFCGYPEGLARSAAPPLTASDGDDVEGGLDSSRVGRSRPPAGTLQELQRLIAADLSADPLGPAAERDGGFYCGYPPQLVFGFHVPTRIDAGLRWCFDCGAWQPCACPRSVGGQPVPLPVEDDPQSNQTVLDRMWEASRSLGRKMEALNDAMEEIEAQARREVEARHPELFLSRWPAPLRRYGQIPDPGLTIKYAFGILIPGSGNRPTIERYFAKPISGNAPPAHGPAGAQAKPILKSESPPRRTVELPIECY